LLNNPGDMNELVHGNYEDKYHASNPISKYLMSNFLKAFSESLLFISNTQTIEVCEVGCAEGELLKIMYSTNKNAKLFATDIAEGEIQKAQENCRGFPIQFSVQNAESLQEYGDEQFDLVVCCEVLEHLQNPLKGLRELYRISRKHILVSVPREPIWRFLNMLRGKYLSDFGNTPGHLNHWTVSQFPRFLMSVPGWKIVGKKYPFPWQMVLLKKIDG